MTRKAEGGNDPSEAFAALGDPVRVGIIETLADRDRTKSQSNGPGLPFSTLRKRVGVTDSGRFRYHLEQLRGLFVEQTAAGQYHLTAAGGQVVSAIVRGTYTDHATVGPTELDSSCPICSGRPIGKYDNGVLQVSCPNDHQLFVWALAPNAARVERIEPVIDIATREFFHTIEVAHTGVCPDCFSPIDTAIERVDAPNRALRFRAPCGPCGSTLDAPAGLCLVSLPELRLLYHHHDRSIYDRFWWQQEFARSDPQAAPPDSDPASISFEIGLERELLAVTLSETAGVIDASLTAMP
ncbi:winged helix-turn-helix domain-containing protein [Halocatena halophila]|uniref:winged helix-turn-helix domain-containing protein n=1 Tax=Halocatena halophila TaxID=2814576 RepID=UPI002ED1BE16